ncbi:endonuclease/exonuclease/phosphatase family protein [Parapedobacter sp. SGR-10]|uniref:endonuclease/exonuclease/phosphatase family protein n=1 Tax=Parapedobacter sp. SGR-10 TaxID=2710879 RepID=UPI0013D3DB1E|nr:endonuclease/exonuclease/phosphatase family protein [Parapedobacter sp. SGR-10]NGF55882.1 endonuclease/exonuclease/phosphatase family protein [Parapedobacter sp. SGR-10]
MMADKRRQKLGYFSKTVFIANVLAVIALLLSYGAGYIDPASFWPLAFFGLAYLPILLVNLGFVFYWLVRKRRYMLLSLVPIVAGWTLLSKHINFKNSQAKLVVKPENNIRIMSFNAHLFQHTGDMNDDFKEETIELVNTVNPDIICFQEFYSRIRGDKQFAKMLKEQGSFEDYYFEPTVKNDLEGYGQAVFSKFPIIHSGSIAKHGYGVNRIIFVDIKREADTLRIYNVHLRSFALQEEDKEFIQKSASEQVKDEAGTKRIGRKLKRAFTNRSEQAKLLRSHIDGSPYPCVVAGDFNDTPMSYSVNLIGKGLKNAFLEQGFGWGVTHYEMLPIFQIDYIFCSKQFQVDNYGIVKERLSDHYPIWADLGL